MSFPVRLEVVSSKDVKSKKRWRRTQWDGEESENISLLGRNTLSQFNLVTGKKRRVDVSLRKLLGRVVYINGSVTGACIVGMLQDGHIFRWRKNTRTITNIQPCPDFTPSPTMGLGQSQSSKKPKLFVSDDGGTILLFSSQSGIFIWRTVGVMNSGWTRITISTVAAMFLTSKGVVLDTVFCTDQVVGSVCQCAFVSSTSENINVGIVSVKHDQSHPTMCHISNKYPFAAFHPSLLHISSKESLLPCWSRNGKILAVAVNQKQPFRAKILLVHPLSGGVVTVSFGRVLQNAVDTSFWMSDLSWTCDHLFLACATKQGAVLLVSANGNIMKIIAKSPAEQFGPGKFLPLEGVLGFRRPIVDGLPKEIDDSTDTSMQSSILPPKLRKPHYTVSAHPTLPILLCGDGYSVAAVKISDAIKHRDIVTISLAETVQRIDRVIKKNNLQVTICEPLSYFVPHRSKTNLSEVEQRWRQVIRSTHSRLVPGSLQVVTTDKSMEQSPEQLALLSFLIEDLDDSRLAISGSRIEESFNGASVVEDQGPDLVSDLRSCHANLLSTLMLLSTADKGKGGTGQESNKPNIGHFTDTELENIHARTLKLYCDILLQMQEIADIIPLERVTESFLTNNDDQPSMLRDIISDSIGSLGRGILSLISWRDLSRPTFMLGALVEEITVTRLMCGRQSSEGCLVGVDVLENVLQAVLFLTKAEECMKKQINAHFQSISSFVGGIPEDDYALHSELHFGSAWGALVNFIERLCSAEAPFHKPFSLPGSVLPYLQAKTLHRIISHLPVLDDQEISATKNLAHMCHCLRGYRLPHALFFAYSNLCYLNGRMKKWTDEKWLPIEILSSVMASYFCGSSVKVPSITSALTDAEQKDLFNERYVLLKQEIITESVRAHSLDESWNINNAVLLMLSCGRIKEAAKISSDVGDWRTSFSLSAVFEKTSFSSLSEDATEGHTDALLKNRFQDIASCIFGVKVQVAEACPCIIFERGPNFSEVNAVSYATSLRDLYEIAAMVGVDIATWSVCALLNNLRSRCTFGLPLVVAENFSLPHPQLYLPQSCSQFASEDSETQLRSELSAYARTLLTIFNCIGIQRIVALWYLKWLDREVACENAHHDTCCARRKVPTLLSDFALLKDVTLQGLELTLDNLHSNSHRGEIYFLAAAFRELCATLWLFNIRDQLTSAVRKYQAAREKYCDGVTESQKEEVWTTIHECLFWIRKIIPFLDFFHLESEVEELVLCLVAELPMSTEMAFILAEFFHRERFTSPKTKHRLTVAIEKMRLTEVHTGEGDGPSKPLSTIFNEQCRNLEKARKPTSGHFHALKAPATSKSAVSIGTLQTDTLSRDEPSIASKTYPDDIVATLDCCYAFEADEMYHSFVFEFLEIALSKSPATTTFTPKKNRKSGAASRPLQYPLVLTYRNEIAMLNLEMIPPPDENIGVPLAMNVPVPCQEETSDQAVTKQDPEKSVDAIQHCIVNWDYFTKNRYKMVETGIRFVHQTRPIPRISLEKLAPHVQKRVQRLVSYFSWLEHWRTRQISVPRKALLEKQRKPAIRVSISIEHLIHGFTMAELRFGKKVKKKERRQLEQKSTIASSVHWEEVDCKSEAGEMPSIIAEDCGIVIDETVPKVIDKVDSEIVARDEAVADELVSVADDHLSVNPSELQYDPQKLEESVHLENDNFLKNSVQEETDCGQDTLLHDQELPPKQQEESETLKDQEATLDEEGDKRVSEISETHHSEQNVPGPSSGTLLRTILQKDSTQRTFTQATDVISHSGLSVASTGLQSDVMADGGGKVRGMKFKKDRDKQEMQDLVRNEIQSAMVGQQVLFLAQILQSAMMQASNFMSQANVSAPPTQKAATNFEKAPPPPTQQPGDGKLKILSLDGKSSYLPSNSRYSLQPSRVPLKILGENKSFRKSQTVLLHDEKQNAPKIHSPIKSNTEPTVVPTMYTGHKHPVIEKASHKLSKPQESPSREAGVSILTPDMLSDSKPNALPAGKCAACQSHSAPKTTVKLPLLSLADAISARNSCQHAPTAKALPRLINITQVLRYEQKRMEESGLQSQSIVHMGKALPLLEAEKIPGFYRRKPVMREVPFSLPTAKPRPQTVETKEAETQGREIAHEPQIDGSVVEIPSELLPRVLTEEEASEIRNGVLAHYKTVVDQQKLMWRESGQQTDDVEEEHERGVGPSVDQSVPQAHFVKKVCREKPITDRYEMHQEFMDRFLDVEKSEIAGREVVEELKAQDVTQMQGIDADMKVPAVQTLVKSRWSTAMDQMSSEMDAVAEMDRNERYRLPLQAERPVHDCEKPASDSIRVSSQIGERHTTRSSSEGEARSTHSSVVTPVVPAHYIPPSDLLLGIGSIVPEKRPRETNVEYTTKPRAEFSVELKKYRRKLDEAFSLADFGPRPEHGQRMHSVASLRQLTPASSVHRMDSSALSSLSWDELEAMVTESLVADAEGEPVSNVADISNVDGRIQDALEILNELQSDQADLHRKIAKNPGKRPPPVQSEKDKKREADVDARIHDAMSLLNEIKKDHKQVACKAKPPHLKAARGRQSTAESGSLDNWTLEAMSLLQELKSEFEPEHRRSIAKENLPPPVTTVRTDSNSLRAHIEEAMAVLRNDATSSPFSHVPSSHVSFQPASQMPRRYY